MSSACFVLSVDHRQLPEQGKYLERALLNLEPVTQTAFSDIYVQKICCRQANFHSRLRLLIFRVKSQTSWPCAFLWRFLLTTLHFLIQDRRWAFLWRLVLTTKKELIGCLGYIKCIASLSIIKLSSCYLAFRGIGQDKITPPHRVKKTVHAPSGLCACLSLKQEQSSTRPSLLVRS